VRVEIVLLIGAAEYVVSDLEARRLEHAIRRRCLDARGRALDDDARACLQLADVLAEGLAAGTPEPIEIGRSHVEGLCAYVLEDEEIAGVDELTDLCDALKRYRDD
jgi:hypothetical protein